MDTQHHFNTSTIYLPSEFCLLHGSLGCHLFRCDHVRVLRLIQRQRCRVQTGLHAAQNNQATSQTQVAQHTHGIKYQCTHHAQHMQHPTEMINISKYRSSTHTVIYLVLFMIILYSPYLISNIVLAVKWERVMTVLRRPSISLTPFSSWIHCWIPRFTAGEWETFVRPFARCFLT